LWENPHALPRAYRAARAEPEPADSLAALSRLVDPDFDLRERVLLDPLPSDRVWSDEAAGHDAPAETRIEVDEPERVVVRTRGPSPAALVLTDAYHPGWEARIDGEPAAILRANTALRAVVVPPGEHRVEMRYRARSLGVGAWLAAATAGGLAAALALERRRAGRGQRRSRRSQTAKAAHGTRPSQSGRWCHIHQAALPSTMRALRSSR
jgi:hypothetical protein